MKFGTSATRCNLCMLVCLTLKGNKYDPARKMCRKIEYIKFDYIFV